MQHATGFVHAAGQADADAEHLLVCGELAAQLQEGGGQDGDAGAHRAAGAEVGHGAGLDLAGQRSGHDPHRLHADLGTEQQQAAGVDEERRGAAADVAGGHHVALQQPAFGDELLHEGADGGLGQAHGAGQVGTRQPRVGTQMPHQRHAIDDLEQLLAAGGFGLHVSPVVVGAMTAL